MQEASLDSAAADGVNSSAQFKQLRQQWLDRLEPELRRGESGRALTEALSDYWDDFISTHYHLHLRDRADECGLFALGGYGRREMAPFSDVDLMVLVPEPTPDSADAPLLAAVEVFIRSLWALGVKLGHSVRTARQCLSLSRENTSIASSLLDARWIAGAAPDQFDPAEAVKEMIRADGALRFVALIAEGARHRHRKFGDSAYLLEPHVKLGRGGLRDLQALEWSAMLLHKRRVSGELVDLGVAWPGEAERLARAGSYLLRTRFALHLHHGWKQDQLTYAAQGAVAEMMGYGQTHIAESLTRFMQAYYLHARELAVISDLWLASWTHTAAPTPPGEAGATAAQRLTVDDPDEFAQDPTRIFELLSRAQRRGLELHPQARRAMASAARGLPPSVAIDSHANRVVRTIICDVDDPGELLRTIAEAGVLARVVPEWAHLVGHAQHDTYHVYTTDVHLLTVCQRLKELLRGDLSERVPYLSRVAARYRTQHPTDPLLLASLLHDVGKGLDGDHSIIGAGLAAEVAHRMRFPAKALLLIRRLVVEHLLMPKISQRRDLRDRATMRSFCRLVGSSELLDGLVLLSFADMDSVGPRHLTDWKLGLLEELHRQAERFFEESGPAHDERAAERLEVLRSVLESDLPASTVDRLLEDLPTRFVESFELPQLVRSARLLARATGDEPQVAFHDTPDRFFTEVQVFEPSHPGRLADVAGVLAAAGLDIRQARSSAVGSGGTIDVFEVCTADDLHKAIPARRRQSVAETLSRVLSGERSVLEVLSRKLGQSRLPPRVRPDVKLIVTIDNTFDPQFTLLEVKDLDRPGLLAHIARVLTDLDLQVDRSIITTEGDRAIDTFYLLDADGERLDDAQSERVRLALLERLSTRP